GLGVSARSMVPPTTDHPVRLASKSGLDVSRPDDVTHALGAAEPRAAVSTRNVESAGPTGATRTDWPGSASARDTSASPTMPTFQGPPGRQLNVISQRYGSRVSSHPMTMRSTSSFDTK